MCRNKDHSTSSLNIFKLVLDRFLSVWCQSQCICYWGNILTLVVFISDSGKEVSHLKGQKRQCANGVDGGRSEYLDILGIINIPNIFFKRFIQPPKV